MGYVTSKPTNPNKSNNQSHNIENDVINVERKIEIQNNDAIPKALQSRSLADSPWPMYHHDINHTSQSQYNTSSNPGQLVWSYNTYAPVRSSPAIGSDGTIYVGSDGGSLFAIQPNGIKKWQFPTAETFQSSPAISSNGTIYIGCDNNRLYAIDPNGTKLWDFQVDSGIKSSPAIDNNGTIYIGSDDDNIYAINPNGTEKWSYDTLDWIRSSPAIGPNGTVYVNSGGLYAFYPGGGLKWIFGTEGSVEWSSPLIGPDGTIYSVSPSGKLFAIYPNGTEKWSSYLGISSFVSPAMGSDGTIYVGTYGDNLSAIYPNGTGKWSFKTGGLILSSPAIGSDGTIYIGSTDKKLYAIYPNGTEKWSYLTEDWIRSSPAIDHNGTVYIGSDDGYLYAIGFVYNLTSIDVTPSSGYTNTEFNYTVQYLNVLNQTPVFFNVSVDGINYTLNEVNPGDLNFCDGKNYYYNTTLNISLNHTFQFILTLDGGLVFSTNIINAPDVYNAIPVIITSNTNTAYEEVYYNITYEYMDIDNITIAQVCNWSYSTNATWLTFNTSTARLYGTPTNDDVGSYWVNISINDTIDMDFTNFTLTVENVNDNPLIETTDVEVTYEDELYEVDYNASDIDSLITNQVWSLEANATSWLDIDTATGIISGIPTNDDVGEYWVNVSVDDGDTGLAFTNFTLIVLNVNDRPEIITDDELTANVNILYVVDYNATDIDSPLSQLTWSLNTNATWLDLDTSTGILSGTPIINDVGWYNVNITVDDGDEGQDWHDFILTVTSEDFENKPPEITTLDAVSTTAGKSYYVIYEAIDDRTHLESLTWSYNSNASWLSFNKITRVLSGNPTLSDVGWYWVNVTVFDEEGKFDSHNFTLTVWATANHPPNILTEDDINAVVDEMYSVDYEAEDDRTPIDKLVWSLETNTTEWLDIDPKTGVLSGTPELEDVGSYWVKVSVFDDEDGWDFTNFTLYVTTEPITEFKPELSNPTMTPTTGDTNTEFTFSVDYSHPDGDLPDSIQVVIDGEAHNMTSNNGHYEYSTKLSEGDHTYYFTTKLGGVTFNTDAYNTGFITKAEGQPEDGDGGGDEDNTMFYAGIGIIVIIIIVVLILLFIFLRKKKGKEEELPVEEAQPPPIEDVPPVESPIADTELTNLRTEEPAPPPPEQPVIQPEQPPTPEVPPPEGSIEETEHMNLRTEEPAPSPPEQPLPPEVTPQVIEPQVESAPEPAPMPQAEEQPAPQSQVEPQPEGQAPVPSIKEKITDQKQ
jgi:outer membrane protein assembly factor BamB